MLGAVFRNSALSTSSTGLVYSSQCTPLVLAKLLSLKSLRLPLSDVRFDEDLVPESLLPER